jgi:hypothetical protein
MRSQFLDLLKDIGFLPYEVNTSNVAGRYENRNGGDRGMLGAVLCAGLAPNILQIPYSSRAVVSGTMAKKIAEVGLNSRKGNSESCYDTISFSSTLKDDFIRFCFV